MDTVAKSTVADWYNGEEFVSEELVVAYDENDLTERPSSPKVENVEVKDAEKDAVKDAVRDAVEMK